MDSAGSEEQIIVNCAECGVPILAFWDNGLVSGEYVLIADWLFHPKCWDEKVERDPP